MCKTIALKAIYSEGSVHGQFVDRICFMLFGQDATLQKVREEMCRCVTKFGGKELVKEMRRASSFGNPVN